MQRGLVDDGAADDGGSVLVLGEAEPVEPGGPAGVEVPLEPDFVFAGIAPSAGVVAAAGRCGVGLMNGP